MQICSWFGSLLVEDFLSGSRVGDPREYTYCTTWFAHSKALISNFGLIALAVVFSLNHLWSALMSTYPSHATHTFQRIIQKVSLLCPQEGSFVLCPKLAGVSFGHNRGHEVRVPCHRLRKPWAITVALLHHKYRSRWNCRQQVHFKSDQSLKITRCVQSVLHMVYLSFAGNFGTYALLDKTPQGERQSLPLNQNCILKSIISCIFSLFLFFSM